jgi:hypothetical protein
VAIFGKMSNDLYEARKLRPDENSIRQWTTSWKPTITKRLRDLHLGQHAITNLRFCMMGPSPDEKSMKPTIVVICAESNRKEVETSLASFIKISIPTGIDFKVASGSIKPASGGSSEVISQGDRSNLGARIRFTASENLLTLVGAQMRVQARDCRALYPVCTIGGIIMVGDTLYALSVAHSMFGLALEVANYYSILDWISLGKVKSYKWSGNEIAKEYALKDVSLLTDDREEQTPMDWMLIRLGADFMLPNLFRDPNGESRQSITGSLKTVEFTDDDVCVCGGVTGTQCGILDTTPTLILYGQASYEVLSISLEHPLGMYSLSMQLVPCTKYRSGWRFWRMGH